MWIWSHLLKKSIMENFIFCAVTLHITVSKRKNFFSHIYINFNSTLFLQTLLQFYLNFKCSTNKATMLLKPKIYLFWRFYSLRYSDIASFLEQHVQSILKVEMRILIIDFHLCLVAQIPRFKFDF